MQKHQKIRLIAMSLNWPEDFVLLDKRRVIFIKLWRGLKIFSLFLSREKSEIHRMVIQGGSFKGRSGDLKPKEVVSLLLDDEEIEQRMREKAAEAERRPEAEAPVTSAVIASSG
jgi:hypothetical protein